MSTPVEFESHNEHGHQHDRPTTLVPNRRVMRLVTALSCVVAGVIGGSLIRDAGSSSRPTAPTTAPANTPRPVVQTGSVNGINLRVVVAETSPSDSHVTITFDNPGPTQTLNSVSGPVGSGFEGPESNLVAAGGVTAVNQQNVGSNTIVETIPAATVGGSVGFDVPNAHGSIGTLTPLPPPNYFSFWMDF